MTGRILKTVVAALMLVGAVSSVANAQTMKKAASLGSVRLTHDVMADWP